MPGNSGSPVREALERADHSWLAPHRDRASGTGLPELPTRFPVWSAEKKPADRGPREPREWGGKIRPSTHSCIPCTYIHIFRSQREHPLNPPSRTAGTQPSGGYEYIWISGSERLPAPFHPLPLDLGTLGNALDRDDPSLNSFPFVYKCLYHIVITNKNSHSPNAKCRTYSFGSKEQLEIPSLRSYAQELNRLTGGLE